MRILTVTHYQPPHPGGIETVAAALVDRYRQAGHEVVWLASDLPVLQMPDSGCIRVRAWNILEDLVGVPYPLWHPGALAKTQQLVEWCDVAHCHDCLYLGTLMTCRYAHLANKPVLLTQHVGPVPYRSFTLRTIQQLAYAMIGRHIHRRVDQVVFISYTVRAWFEARIRYRRAPLFLANGVDGLLFQFVDEATRCAHRRELKLPRKQRIALFVGRFVDKKGIPVVEEVARRCPEWLFVLLGEGPIDPRSWELGNVVVRPFQSQETLRSYYGASDVLLLPSTGEGFPLVVMEAMACGTPTIISSETFAAWNHGREHFIVAEANAHAVAAQLGKHEKLLTSATRRAVAQYARAHWNWESVAEAYLRLLVDLYRRG